MKQIHAKQCFPSMSEVLPHPTPPHARTAADRAGRGEGHEAGWVGSISSGCIPNLDTVYWMSIHTFVCIVYVSIT